MRNYISNRAHKSIFIAWFICSLAALFYTYEYMLRIEPGVMTSDLQLYFTLSAGGLGLLVSMYYWGYTPLQLIVGLLVDYFGARRVLIVAILLCVFGTFLFGFTHSYIVASIARLFIGIGSAFAFVGALKLAADWLPRRFFAFYVGLCVSLGMLGAMFGETVMSWIVDHVGWHPVISDSVWLGIALVAVFMLFVYEKHEVVYHEHTTQDVSFAMLGKTLIALLGRKRILQVGFIGCAGYLSLSMLAEQWANPYFQKVLYGDAQTSSYFVDMIFFGWCVGAPLNGYLSEKLQSRKKVLMAGFVLALISFIPVIVVPRQLPEWMLSLLLFLFGLFSSSQSVCFAIARDVVETRLAATAAGLVNAMVMVSGMIVQPIFAYSLNWFSKSTGRLLFSSHFYTLATYQKSLWILPIFLVVSIVVIYYMEDSYDVGAGTKQRQRIRLPHE